MMGAKFEEFNFSASELSEILDEVLDSDERDVEITADTLRCMQAMAILCNKRIDGCNASLHRADEMIKELEKRVQLGKSIISRLVDKDGQKVRQIPLAGTIVKDIWEFYSGT